MTQALDIASLLTEFADNTSGNITALFGRNLCQSAMGYSAASDPGVNNDAVDTAALGQQFGVGSRWLNTSSNTLWTCFSGATGAAVWKSAPTTAGGDLTGTYPNPTVAQASGIFTLKEGVVFDTTTESANTFDLLASGLVYSCDTTSNNVSALLPVWSLQTTGQVWLVYISKGTNVAYLVPHSTDLINGVNASLLVSGIGAGWILIADVNGWVAYQCNFIPASGVSAGSYGSASAVGTFTVGADGRLTAASNTSIALAASAITSGTLAVANGGTGVTSLPSCSCHNSTTQSINNASATALTANTDDWNAYSMHSTSSNSSRITCGLAGKYIVSGSVAWTGHADTNNRTLFVYKNGSSTNCSTVAFSNSGAIGMTQNICTQVNLAATDYVELYGLQASGGALNVTLDQWSAVWVAP